MKTSVVLKSMCVVFLVRKQTLQESIKTLLVKTGVASKQNCHI